MMKIFQGHPFLWLFLCLVGMSPQNLFAQPANEYQVKAGFLFNFAKFITWPEAAFPSPDAPFIIAIVGEDPFGVILDQAVTGKQIQDRPIIVRRFATLDDLDRCHILFASRSESDQYERIFEHARLLFALTVGESEQFTRRGGSIDFVISNQKIRFEINSDAARRTDVRINAKLLKLAMIVKTGS